MKTLVVDDDPTSRFFLQEILTPYGEIHSCVNGVEAIQAFQRSLDQGSPYQLVCLDIMMPSTNGIQALQEIRQAEERKNPGRGSAAKVLMTTALDAPQSVMTAFREQCDGYLVKPIHKAKLMDCLRSLALIA